MNNVVFSQEAASILNTIKDIDKRMEFQEAAQYAVQYGKDNPFKLMPTKFKPMFKEQG
jgi:hypothetical protein